MQKKLISTNLIEPLKDSAPSTVSRVMTEILNSKLEPNDLYPHITSTYSTFVDSDTPRGFKRFHQFLYFLEKNVKIDHPKIYRAIKRKLFEQTSPPKNGVLPNYNQLRKVYTTTRHNPGIDDIAAAYFTTRLLQANKPYHTETTYTGNISQATIQYMDKMYGDGFTLGLMTQKNDFTFKTKHIMSSLEEFTTAKGTDKIEDALETLIEKDYKTLYVVNEEGTFLGEINAGKIWSINDPDMLDNEVSELLKDKKAPSVDVNDRIEPNLVHDLNQKKILPVTAMIDGKEVLTGIISTSSLRRFEKQPKTAFFHLGANEHIKTKLQTPTIDGKRIALSRPYAIFNNQSRAVSYMGVESMPNIQLEAASLVSIYINQFENSDYPLSEKDIIVALTAIYNASNQFNNLKGPDKEAVKKLLDMMGKGELRTIVESDPIKLLNDTTIKNILKLLE